MTLKGNRLVLLVRILLGGIFIAASVDKILNPLAFAKIIYNYQLLPESMINLTAIVLPWAEVMIGLFLILGIWLPGAIIFANLLLAAFFAALIFNTARGLNVHCGCFSTNPTGDPATLWYFIRDFAFLTMGGLLFYSTFLKKSH